MGSIWCVKPEVVTYDLAYVDDTGESHPFWIKLKKRLTVGEEKRIVTAGWRGFSAASPTEQGDMPRIDINWQTQGFARAEAYLTEWSLEDENRVKLPKTLAVLETLNPDVFALIENAITRHIEAVAGERQALAGGSRPSAT